MRRPGTIFHLEFKAGGHHYFGSIAAIFDFYDSGLLQITKQSLYNYNIELNKPYSNSKITIRKGFITRKKGKRKPPKQ